MKLLNSKDYSFPKSHNLLLILYEWSGKAVNRIYILHICYYFNAKKVFFRKKRATFILLIYNYFMVLSRVSVTFVCNCIIYTYYRYLFRNPDNYLGKRISWNSKQCYSLQNSLSLTGQFIYTSCCMY